MGDFWWVAYLFFPAIAVLVFLSIASDSLRRELAVFERRKIKVEKWLAFQVEAEKESCEVVVIQPDEPPTDDADSETQAA